MMYFDIISQDRYHIELKRIEIEDASEHFLTEEEVKDLKISANPGWHPFKSKIKASVNRWIAKIPEGKKSIKCTDADLITALVDSYYNRCDSLCDFGIKTHSRTGNRFILKSIKKDRTKPTKLDWFKLCDVARKAFAYHTIYIRQGGMTKDLTKEARVKMLTSIKKVVTWESMLKGNKDLGRYYSMYSANKLQMSMIKKMWTTPPIVEKI